MRPGAKALLWESAEMPVLFQICDIQPAGKGFPATVAVESTEGMIGLAAATGKTRWRCEVPQYAVSSGLLATDVPLGLPRIKVDGPGLAQTCYLALATDDRGRCLPPQPAPRQYDAEFVDRRLLRPLPWNLRPGTGSFQQAGSTTAWIVAIILAAIASIIGWWPGKLRRAARLFGLWLVFSLVIETLRFILDTRELDPSEHYDWSNWWAVSTLELHAFYQVLLLVVALWWLVRITCWSARWISTRMRSSPAPLT
jgi:hypothetical protein